MLAVGEGWDVELRGGESYGFTGVSCDDVVALEDWGVVVVVVVVAGSVGGVY